MHDMTAARGDRRGLFVCAIVISADRGRMISQFRCPMIFLEAFHAARHFGSPLSPAHRSSSIAASAAMRSSPSAHAAKPTLTSADYAKWETLGTGALSPDGKWVAYDFRRGNGSDRASLSRGRRRQRASGRSATQSAVHQQQPLAALHDHARHRGRSRWTRGARRRRRRWWRSAGGDTPRSEPQQGRRRRSAHRRDHDVRRRSVATR